MKSFLAFTIMVIGLPLFASSEVEIKKEVNEYFIQNAKALYGISDAQSELEIIRVNQDPNFQNRRLVVVSQLFKGIRVEFVRAIVEFELGKGVIRVNHELVPTVELASVKTSPDIDPTDAVGRAATALKIPAETKTYRDPYLIILKPSQFPAQNNQPRLAYAISFKDRNRMIAYLDAHDGRLIVSWSNLQTSR